MNLRSTLERWAGGPAALYDRATRPLEAGAFESARAELVAGLEGDVLELGCGTGATFVHYDARARVSAVEPEPDFRRVAGERASAAAARVSVHAGDGDALPFPSASFDAAVASLVLCSVADPVATLTELRRVLRPGGDLRLLEHVRHETAWVARLQDALDPLWSALEGRGCHLGRDTTAHVLAAGFELREARRLPLPGPADAMFPLVLLRATRAD